MGKIKKHTQETSLQQAAFDLELKIQNFDFHAAAGEVKADFLNWQRVTEDLIIKLWVAKKALSRQGHRSDLVDVTPGHEEGMHSWQEFCDCAQVSRRTVDRWLERFVPEENRVLLPEELKARKKIEAAEKERERQYLIEQYEDTGVKPDGWDTKVEKQYKHHLIQKTLENNAQVLGTDHQFPSITQAAMELKNSPQLDGDDMLFFEVFQRNEKLLIKTSKTCKERDQIFFLYALEEYINAAEPENRQEFIQQIVGKLQTIMDEINL